MVPLWNMVNISMTFRWKTLISPFASRYELQIVSWLGVGLWSSVLQFCLVWACAAFVCSVCHVLCEIISSIGSGRCCFLGLIHNPWLLKPGLSTMPYFARTVKHVSFPAFYYCFYWYLHVCHKCLTLISISYPDPWNNYQSHLKRQTMPHLQLYLYLDKFSMWLNISGR